MIRDPYPPPLNPALSRWIEEAIALCRPAAVHFCDGSDAEYDALIERLIETRFLIALNPTKRPHSFWCHSHPDDVARVEESTFICSKTKEEAGPTNNWVDPIEMKQRLSHLFSGAMQGRTLYVVPYCMGPLDSPYSIIGVQLTDSPYAVLNMKIMTRMGRCALEQLKERSFIPGLHSVGIPLTSATKDVAWPCNPAIRTIAHFPEERSIYSIGSGYGGNALLGKKCLALRIASCIGKEDGWLAEHMLILGITNPQGEKKYIAAAFPSACGKTNLAMMTPSLPGWKVETVGDDIAWIHIGPDGRFWAINPEAGYFGVAPGTSMKTNPNAMRAIEKNTLFTNVALTQERDVWWEGIGTPPPPHLTTWLGAPYDPNAKLPAAHPNSRFTVPATQNPIYDKAADDPRGVPLCAILFGGRRARTMPLVVESLSWNHGVLFGASISSETTAAAKGEIGKLRHDPFAMLPFCGYNMGDYFAHWIEMGKKTTPDKLPRIYAVNWFLKSENDTYLWPGFGDNIRVLKWIFERTCGAASAETTPIGNLPCPAELDLPAGSPLLAIDPSAWRAECHELFSYFERFEHHMPRALLDELAQLQHRLL